MNYKSGLVQCWGTHDKLKRKRYCRTIVGHQSFLMHLLSLPNRKSNVKCKGNDICNTVLLALVIASRESMINLNLKMSAVLFLRASQQNINTIQWTLCSSNVWKILVMDAQELPNCSSYSASDWDFLIWCVTIKYKSINCENRGSTTQFINFP